MLIVLLIFALFRTLRGVPLASPPDPPDPFPALALRDAPSHFGERTINDIVISCFATIFACTWSAIHPNIPAVTDSKWTCFKRQVTTMIYALLAPELVTLWAMRQRIAAKKIIDEYNKGLGMYKYRRTIYLPLYIIVINDLTPVSRRNTLSERFKGSFQAILDTVCGVFKDSPLPESLEEGKGPQWTLAHGFFLQMGGFMLCENGRPIQTLIDSSRSWAKYKRKLSLIWNIQLKVIDPPRITEEDIQDRSKGDTISKIFIVLQTTWFVVQCIARWSQRLPVTELEVVTLGFAMLNGITYGLWWDKPQNVGRPVFLESKKPREDTSGTSVESSTAGNHTTSLLWRLPFQILQALGSPLNKMMGGDDTVTKMRVGMFYTAAISGKEAAYAAFAIAALFGSVHLIPSWFLHFSSHQEMWLWRVSAIIITAEPVMMGLITYVDQKFLVFFFGEFVAVGFVLYPFARIILLALSLTALRSLSSGALQTIEWTTFIPHL